MPRPARQWREEMRPILGGGVRVDAKKSPPRGGGPWPKRGVPLAGASRTVAGSAVAGRWTDRPPLARPGTAVGGANLARKRFGEEEEDALITVRQVDEHPAVGVEMDGHFLSAERSGQRRPVAQTHGQDAPRSVAPPLAQDQRALGGVESHGTPRERETGNGAGKEPTLRRQPVPKGASSPQRAPEGVRGATICA